MRKLSLLAVAAVAGACSGGANLQPVALAAPAPESPPVTLECVTRELDNLGYETTANPAESSVTGIRINEPPLLLQWLYGNTADQITATVDDGQLRMTAVSSHPDEIGEVGPPETGASENATRNAQSTLETCS